MQLIMCGDRLRHKYFAIQLIKTFPDMKVIIENHPEGISLYQENPSELMKKHFEDFNDCEKDYFGMDVLRDIDLLKEHTLRIIPFGTINDKENVEFIKELCPKKIFVYSTSIIRKELLDCFHRRIINLHAGVSPYYRGSGCNMWAIYHKDWENIGMTIHLMDDGIDSGDIRLNTKINANEYDNFHTMSCSLLDHTISELIGVIKNKSWCVCSQDLSLGVNYKKRYFTDAVLKVCYKNFEEYKNNNG